MNVQFNDLLQSNPWPRNRIFQLKKPSLMCTNLWKAELLFWLLSGNTNGPVWYRNPKFSLVQNVVLSNGSDREVMEGKKENAAWFHCDFWCCELVSVSWAWQVFINFSHTGACLLIFWNLLPFSVGITQAVPLVLANTFPSVCSLTTCVSSEHSAVHILHTEASSALRVPCLDRTFCRIQLAYVR